MEITNQVLDFLFVHIISHFTRPRKSGSKTVAALVGVAGYAIDVQHLIFYSAFCQWRTNAIQFLRRCCHRVRVGHVERSVLIRASATTICHLSHWRHLLWYDHDWYSVSHSLANLCTFLSVSKSVTFQDSLPISDMACSHCKTLTFAEIVVIVMCSKLSEFTFVGRWCYRIDRLFRALVCLLPVYRAAYCG